MPEVVVPAAPAAAPAPHRFELPASADTSVEPVVAPQSEAPTGEKPVVADKPAPAGETPAKPNGEDEKQDRARHRRQLNTAYRKHAEAQARADFLEKENVRLRQPAAAEADPAAPKLENFKDIEEFAAAREKYGSEKALKDHQAKQRTETQKQEHAKLVDGWEAKTVRADSKYEDFDEIVGDLKPTAPWAVAVMEADNGEEIAYFLGKNLKEAERIASLPWRSQIREIGKLEAKLAAEPPKPKTPSKAPAPITPLTGTTPVVSSDLSDPNLSDAEWNKRRNKQVHGKR